MNLENKLLVSITAGFLNMLLSISIPCLIKNVKKPFMVKVKTVFNNNKKLILTSSLLISILVFIALTITDELNNVFVNYNNSKLDNTYDSSELFYSVDTKALLQSTDDEMFVTPGQNMSQKMLFRENVSNLNSMTNYGNQEPVSNLNSMLARPGNNMTNYENQGTVSNLTSMLDRTGNDMTTYENQGPLSINMGKPVLSS